MRLQGWSGLAIGGAALAFSHAASAETVHVDLGGGVDLELVLVPEGRFTQGSHPQDPGHAEDEGQRTVTLSHAFLLGKTPVTMKQFRRFVDETHYVTEAEKGTSGGFGWTGTDLVQKKEFNWQNPGYPTTPDHPVTIVTFADANAFAGWLQGRAQMAVRLPTEAEYERAARGNATTRFIWGDDAMLAERFAWFAKTGPKGAQPVGKMPASSLGLFDMTGNVWEWCSDYYGPIDSNAVIDPRVDAPVTWKLSDKPRRVLKGGSWHTDDRMKLRIAARNRATDGSRNADFGFRVVALPGVPPSSVDSSPPPPTPTAPGPTTPSSGSTSKSTGPSLLVPFIGVASVGAIAVYLLGRKKGRAAGSRPRGGRTFSTRMGADGFWIDASGDVAEGDEVNYVAFVGGQRMTGRARLTSSDRGTFVYTGTPPTRVDVSELFIDNRGPTRGVASMNDYVDPVDRYPNNSGSSGGWPSAY